MDFYINFFGTSVFGQNISAAQSNQFTNIRKKQYNSAALVPQPLKIVEHF